MTEAVSSGEFQPNPVEVLAASIVARETNEGMWSQAVLCEYTPAPPPTALDEISRALAEGTTRAKIEIIEGPEGVAITRPVVDATVAAQVLQNIGEMPDDESVSAIQDLFVTQITEVAEAFRADPQAQAAFAAPLEAAQSVAAEHDVPIHAVYDSDELYAESIRVRHTPESYTIQALEERERNNQQLLNAALNRAVDVQIGMEVGSSKLSSMPNDIAARRAVLMAELLANKDILAVMESGGTALGAAYRQVLGRTLERFWGAGAVDRLDPPSRALIVDEQPDGSLSAGLERLQQHNDIVKTICMELGWDHTNLSSAQRRYLAMRPELHGLHRNED
jgi:hypothetical protein